MIAILGCGPAGLLAAHACALADRDFVIFSKKVRAVLPGAMYLHRAIPDLTDTTPEAAVQFKKIGTRDGYAKKVYGDPSADCSWDQFEEGYRRAWSMTGVYAKTWEMYQHKVVDMELDPLVIDEIEEDHEGVISTVPAYVLCKEQWPGNYHWQPGVGRHAFTSQAIHVASRLFAPFDRIGTDVIIYNGSPQQQWYRCSSLFGYTYTESVQPLPFATPGKKPLWTNCDCRPKVVRAGRFGQWRKGVLTHHAFERAEMAIGRPHAVQ